MRTEQSIKNSIIAIISNVLTIIIGMIAQTVFLKIMGTEYLGLNSLFSNIISMLSILELGFGSAMIYNLYKPIAENDKERIKALMKFYQKCYRLIAIAVLIVGIIILPFITFFIGDVSVPVNLYLVFGMFVLDSVISYMLTYKRSILYADQKTYIINIIHLLYLLIMNLIQILILYTTKNYILYLIIKILCRLFENIVINIVVNKRYAYLKEKTKKSIDQTTLLEIKQNIKGLFFHKISSYVINSTDNIVISKFLGVAMVGMYSNYHMITNALDILIGQVFSSIVASIGNLFTEKNDKKNIKNYKNIMFINFWIATFCTISFYCIVQPFIVVWLGEKYMLNEYIVLSIAMTFYFQTMRKTLNSFKEAGGVFYVDRYSALCEAIINIVASIVCVYLFGMAGVFLGTIISSMYIFIYAYPKYTYTPLFEKSRKEYIMENLKYLIIFIIIGMMTVLISKIVSFNNYWYQMIYNIIDCLLVPNILMMLIYRKTEEYMYIKNLAKKIVEKVRKDK